MRAQLTFALRSAELAMCTDSVIGMFCVCVKSAVFYLTVLYLPVSYTFLLLSNVWLP